MVEVTCIISVIHGDRTVVEEVEALLNPHEEEGWQRHDITKGTVSRDGEVPVTVEAIYRSGQTWMVERRCGIQGGQVGKVGSDRHFET